MKKADPNCEQCGGRGRLYYSEPGHLGQTSDCNCLKYEKPDLKPGALNEYEPYLHRDNPALDDLPTTNVSVRSYERIGGKIYIADPDPVCSHCGDDIKPKTKRKRHILKRKKRWAISNIEKNIIGVRRALRDMGY